VNLGAAAVLWFGYGLRTQAAFSLISGEVVSEAKIFTQPSALMDVGATPTSSWTIAPAGTGFSLRGTF
jgi:hypothetical protein